MVVMVEVLVMVMAMVVLVVDLIFLGLSAQCQDPKALFFPFFSFLLEHSLARGGGPEQGVSGRHTGEGGWGRWGGGWAACVHDNTLGTDF